jgi:hypothetical protein
MDGDFPKAKDAAAKLISNIAPAVEEMPMLESFLATPIIVLLAFDRWSDILNLPAPEGSLVLTNAVWHAARGIAFAKFGRISEAESEQNVFHDLVAKIPSDDMYDLLNTKGSVLKVYENLLASTIAQSHGDNNTAIDFLKQAVAAEDALNYSEPPRPWYPPLRPLLGKLLLSTNQPAEAEKVFRADLERNPRDARGLAGLRDCLKAEERSYDAEQINQQVHAAWKVYDSKKISR